MEEIKLNVHVRQKFGTRKIKSLYRDELVPGIVYGGKEKKPTAIQIERKEYERIMRSHRGQSVIFHLNVMEGEKKLRDYAAIVREEQHEPVSYRLVHLDFQRISLTEKLEVKVPLETHGEPIGVKRDGGSLEHVLWELDVYCLPTKIPEKIVVEVSQLAIGDAVHVKDIKLPEDVITRHDPDAIVVTVVPPMKEDAGQPSEAPAEPEVLKEKKPEAAAAGEAPEKGEKKAEGDKKDAKK